MEQIKTGDVLQLPHDLTITPHGIKTVPYKLKSYNVISVNGDRIELKKVGGRIMHDKYLSTVKELLAEIELQNKPTQRKDANTLPLWKKLNEERTQGEWRSNNESDCIYIPHSYFDGEKEKDGFKPILYKSVNCGITNETQKANAQYTALAVNNFASIVEALDPIVNWMEELKRKGVFVQNSVADAIYLKNAKEALSKIS